MPLLRRAYPNGRTVGLSKRNAPLGIGLLEIKCSHRLCRSCGGHTRMGERWGLLKRNAQLGIGLLEIKCSHILCPLRGLSCRQNNFFCLKNGKGKAALPTHPPIPIKRGMGLCPMFTHACSRKNRTKERARFRSPAPSRHAGSISPELSPRTGGFSRFWDCQKSPGKFPARQCSPRP